MPGIDNYSVAVLVALNELALRYSIRPCDFVATVGFRASDSVEVRFEAPPADRVTQKRFHDILVAVGASMETLSVAGTERDIYDRIEAAIRVAPKARTRP